MASGNGPSLDCACWKVSTPRLLEGFVQFYLGSWMHKKGVYHSYMEGQKGHEVA